MNIPHAFRILAVDDEWREKLSEDATSDFVWRFLLDVLGVKVHFHFGDIASGEKHALSITGNPGCTINAGFIEGNYPKTSLEVVNLDLCWRYDQRGLPALAPGSMLDSDGDITRTLIDVNTCPAGFWVRVEPADRPKQATTGSSGFTFVEPVEVFVLTFWPFDRLEDLVGARDHHSRFWNVLLLDNLIAAEAVDDCQLWYGPEPEGMSRADNFELFRYFRHPEIKTDKDIRWTPDRRTQVIVEASIKKTSFSGDTNRKIWPWFEIRKDEFTKNPDQAVKEYRSFPMAPRQLSWTDFRDAVWQAAERVQRWHSPRIDSLKDPDGLIEGYSVTDHPVFLIGAPGIGKSFVAEAIHEMSNRAPAPFVSVNCAAIPQEGNFFESTVFGRERNATGGNSPAVLGHIQEAEGGTLFLDEIHHLSKAAQAKLLTFVQDKTYRPLGAETDFEADVRLIVATNRDPSRLIESFELDFLQRLSFYQIRFKALSEYTEAEFLKICRMAFEDVKRKVIGADAVPPALRVEVESSTEVTTAEAERFQNKVQIAAEELNEVGSDQFLLHCTLRGPGRSVEVTRLPIANRSAGATRAAGETVTLREKIEGMLRLRRVGQPLRRLVSFPRARHLPLVTLCPSLIQHVEKLVIRDSVFQQMHYKVVAADSNWKERFDRGGNIRYLRQLLERAIYMHLGRESLLIEHIEQAFESGNEPYSFVKEEELSGTHSAPALVSGGPYRSDSPHRALGSPQASVGEEDRVAMALGALASAFQHVGPTFDLSDVDGDVQSALRILALWCLPGKLLDRPLKFDAWVTRPHTIGPGWEKLATVECGKGTKWHVLVVFSFLRYLKKWDIETWTVSKKVHERIERLCSDRQASEDGGFGEHVEEAWSQLGYQKSTATAARQSRLVDFLQIWNRTTPSDGTSAFFVPGPNAKSEYVEALIQRLRDDVPQQIWVGEIPGTSGMKA